jgi:guanine deaminase
MNEFMRIAIEEARKGMEKGHGGPFGAVIVKDGKILAKSHNMVLKKKDATCHAEINILRDASKKLKSYDLSSCEIYTTGQPCKMCEAALNWAKVKKVYFGNTYKDALNMGFNDESGNNQGLQLIRLDSSETSKLVEEWNSSVKKSTY